MHKLLNCITGGQILFLHIVHNSVSKQVLQKRAMHPRFVCIHGNTLSYSPFGESSAKYVPDLSSSFADAYKPASWGPDMPELGEKVQIYLHFFQQARDSNPLSRQRFHKLNIE